MNKITHAAERKAFQTVLNKMIDRGSEKDVADMAESLLSLIHKIMKGTWKESTFTTLQAIADDPENKWHRYTERILKNTDKGILSTFLLNAAYEGGFRGSVTAAETSEKYNCNVPWIVLMDPTTACNYHCIGCWAAEYGNKHNLSFEDMDRVLTEGKELGIHACLFTGGEPLIRKKDIIRLCEKHRDVAFHAFTNGSLIDDEFCKDLLRVQNFFVSVSVEGYADTNDARRGEGHFNKVMQAAGRLIRTQDDVGVILLLDERFRYRENLALFPREWADYSLTDFGSSHQKIRAFWESREKRAVCQIKVAKCDQQCYSITKERTPACGRIIQAKKGDNHVKT